MASSRETVKYTSVHMGKNYLLAFDRTDNSF